MDHSGNALDQSQGKWCIHMHTLIWEFKPLDDSRRQFTIQLTRQKGHIHQIRHYKKPCKLFGTWNETHAHTHQKNQSQRKKR